MFRKSYKITVKNSCEEDWKQMTDVSCGRYCNACSKVVYDYTNLSTSEIIKSIKKTLEQKCGRFRKDQLDKAFYIDNPHQNNIKRKSLKYFLSLFIVSLQAKNVVSQSNDSIVNQINIVRADSSLGVLDDTTLVQPVDSNSLVKVGDTTLRPIINDSNLYEVSNEIEFINSIPIEYTTSGSFYIEEESVWEVIKKNLNVSLKRGKPQAHLETEYSLALENKGEEKKNETNSFTWEMLLPPMFRFRRKLKKK